MSSKPILLLEPLTLNPYKLTSIFLFALANSAGFIAPANKPALLEVVKPAKCS